MFTSCHCIKQSFSCLLLISVSSHILSRITPMSPNGFSPSWFLKVITFFEAAECFSMIDLNRTGRVAHFLYTSSYWRY